MKNLFFLLAFFFAVASCSTQKNTSPNETVSEIKPQQNEDGEWEIHVLDTNFDYFLSAVARPISMYSEAALKTRNANLVNEWNSYFMSARYRNIIESSIQYDPTENYGIEFEYKLYQVFAYVNWQYGLRMNGLSGADVFRRR